MEDNVHALKWVLKENNLRMWAGFFWLTVGAVF
jgi:hypothetical protein